MDKQIAIYAAQITADVQTNEAIVLRPATAEYYDVGVKRAARKLLALLESEYVKAKQEKHLSPSESYDMMLGAIEELDAQFRNNNRRP